MEVKFLGNWSSHIKAGVKNTSILIDNKTVADFGPHTLEAMLEKGIDPSSVDLVLITHLHLDHYLGLIEFLWYRGSRKLKNTVTVMGPPGIRETTESMLKLVNTPENGGYELNVEYVESGKHDFVSTFKGNHTIPDNVYRLDFRDSSVVYTGDTAYTENVVKAAEDADLLIHEMTYSDRNAERAAYWKHSTCSSTIRVFEESKAKRLAPTHLTDESLEFLQAQARDGIILPFGDIVL